MKAEDVIALRSKINLSQIELGNLLDTSSQTVMKWEQGVKTPSPQQEMILMGLQKLAEKNGNRLDTDKVKNIAQIKGGGGLSHILGLIGGMAAIAAVGTAAALTGFFLPVILGTGTAFLETVTSYFAKE